MLKKLALPGLDKHRDLGILLLRLGIGAMFIAHGLPKLTGGPEIWARLGSTMANLGITFAPTFWGLMAALAETVGGLLLMIGLATRPAAMMLAFTMLVAFLMHFNSGDEFRTWSHAAEAGILFTSMVLIGPGRISVDAAAKKR